VFLDSFVAFRVSNVFFERFFGFVSLWSSSFFINSRGVNSFFQRIIESFLREFLCPFSLVSPLFPKLELRRRRSEREREVFVLF
jgi:hypothetical protein|tara:strand:+ start:356 stop:607 length:252 start_codon:yes stop_codon:yes gene_type:complete